jgi:cation transporter-like permease
MLRGAELPIQSEWIIFAVALTLVGLFSLAVGLLPRSRIARACKTDRDDKKIFSVPLKLLVTFAAISYLVAVVAFLAPHRWNLNPQLMFSLCPLYFVRMMFDPEPVTIFLLLAPMNAAVYGAVGLAFGYARLVFRKQISNATP